MAKEAKIIEEEVKTKVAKRMPPGDRWQPLDNSTVLLESLTDVLEYVYQKNGDNLDHQTTVKLEIPGWVSYDPIAMENAANFFDTFTKKLPGNLMNIFPMDDYIIISYTKGIPEDKFSSIDLQDPNSRQEMDRMNRPFFGILDKNLNSIKEFLLMN